MQSRYELCEKPDSVSYASVAEVVNAAFASVNKIGISFGVNHLTGDELEQTIRDSNGKCFVALDDGRPVGTLSVVHKKYNMWFYKGDAMRLRFMAVLPEYSGQHIASGLVSLAVSYCRDNAAGIITVSTPSNNKAAIHLYTKQSFSKIRFWWNQDHHVTDFAFWMNAEKPSRLSCAVHLLKDACRTWARSRRA